MAFKGIHQDNCRLCDYELKERPEYKIDIVKTKLKGNRKEGKNDILHTSEL